jgi:hypothetical protein
MNILIVRSDLVGQALVHLLDDLLEAALALSFQGSISNGLKQGSTSALCEHYVCECCLSPNRLRIPKHTSVTTSGSALPPAAKCSI